MFRPSTRPRAPAPNTLRVRTPTTTWHLPNELLREIFLFCLPPPGRRPSNRTAPLLLCYVCKAWTAIAINTFQLWDDLLLDSPREMYSEQEDDTEHQRAFAPRESARHGIHTDAITKFAKASSLWLQNCRLRPFNLTLDWTHVPNADTQAIKDVWDTIIETTPNLRSLDLRVREDQHMNALVTPPTHTLDSLEAISFGVFYVVQDQNIQFFDLRSARKLRKLRLRTYGFDLNPSTMHCFPWGQLTHLALKTRLSLPSWHHIIRETPLLQNCHVYFAGTNPHDGGNVDNTLDLAEIPSLIPRTAVTLCHLRELVMTFAGLFSSAIFSNVFCPELQTLKVLNELVGEGFSHDDQPLEFYQNSAPSLTSLTLSHAEMSANQLLSVLRRAPRMKELHIDCEGNHDNLLKALTIRNNSDAEPILPHLTSFQMSAVSYLRLQEGDIPPTFSARIFTEAVISRWNYAKSKGWPFAVGLFVDHDLTPQGKLVERSLSVCKAEGLDLTTGTVPRCEADQDTVDPRGDLLGAMTFY